MVAKKLIFLISIFTGLLFSATPVFAHMIVKPNTVGIASIQNFSLGVPTEKDGTTVGVRLLIPDGLGDVTPDVKSGWKITVKKNGTADDSPVTEIDWTGGSIPSGQRDEFIFSAEVPASPTTLIWKAYQTYDDGSIVTWDQPPATEAASPADTTTATNGSYSQTTVINDLTSSPNPANNTASVSNSTSSNFLMPLAFLALILSVVSIGIQLRRKS